MRPSLNHKIFLGMHVWWDPHNLGLFWSLVFIYKTPFCPLHSQCFWHPSQLPFMFLLQVTHWATRLISIPMPSENNSSSQGRHLLWPALGMSSSKKEPPSCLCILVTQRPSWAPSLPCVPNALGRWHLFNPSRKVTETTVKSGMRSEGWPIGMKISPVSLVSPVKVLIQKRGPEAEVVWGVSCSRCWSWGDLCVLQRTIGSLFPWRILRHHLMLAKLCVGWAHVLPDIPRLPWLGNSLVVILFLHMKDTKKKMTLSFFRQRGYLRQKK